MTKSIGLLRFILVMILFYFWLYNWYRSKILTSECKKFANSVLIGTFAEFSAIIAASFLSHSYLYFLKTIATAIIMIIHSCKADNEETDFSGGIPYSRIAFLTVLSTIFLIGFSIGLIQLHIQLYLVGKHSHLS